MDVFNKCPIDVRFVESEIQFTAKPVAGSKPDCTTKGEASSAVEIQISGSGIGERQSANASQAAIEPAVQTRFLCGNSQGTDAFPPALRMWVASKRMDELNWVADRFGERAEQWRDEALALSQS